MTLEMKYILTAVIMIAKTIASLFQKILEGKGNEIR